MVMGIPTNEGNLASTPFARLLLSLWEGKHSGRLWLKNGEVEKTIFFLKGNLALTESSLPRGEFKTKLIENNLIPGSRAEEIFLLAENDNISFARALIEQQALSPAQVWEGMTELWLDGLFAVFDWTQGLFLFDETAVPAGSEVLRTLNSLEFAFQGLRRMTNFDLIRASLPVEFETLQLLFPDHADLLRLAPHERYLLNLLRSASRLEDLYRESHLGKVETQRVLYSFLQLGLVGPAQGRNKPRSQPERLAGETEKVWAEFNDKCSYVYKYISKEIGPVGVNVLEKAIDEVRARFGPPLQNLELRADGRIDLRPMPFLPYPLSAEDSRRLFLRLLNEILVAEVLAVKKTLGNAHEATLIRNLERIGEGS